MLYRAWNLLQSFVTGHPSGVENGSALIGAEARPCVERLEGRTLLTASNPSDPAVYRIDAGGPAYTDVLGQVWSADSAVGGSANSYHFTARYTQDPKLYTTFRTGNFSYHLPLHNGNYALELLFAEPYDTAGQRVFNVAANGKTLLSRFDVTATVGQQTAAIETFPLTVTSGVLDVDLTAVTGHALLSGLALYPAAAAPPAGSPNPLTILPLGDSITYGSSVGVYPSGGYRSRLYQDLTSSEQPIRYVGSVYDTWSPALESAGEAWFEGHGGYTINQISQNFDGVGPGNPASPNDGGDWINGTSTRGALYPDVILLEAGTNDIIGGHSGSQAAADLSALISKITSERPDADLFVAQITPLVNAKQNAQVKQFNSLLQSSVIPKYQKLGRHVYLVNQYANFVDSQGNVESSLFGDGVHPGRTGYDRMGDTWFNAIQKVLK